MIWSPKEIPSPTNLVSFFCENKSVYNITSYELEIESRPNDQGQYNTEVKIEVIDEDGEVRVLLDPGYLSVSGIPIHQYPIELCYD